MLPSHVDPTAGVLPQCVLDLLSGTSSVSVNTSDHDGNVLVYLAGYIGSKAVEKYSTEKECNILTTDVPDDPRYTFLSDKQYTDLNLGEKGLKVPSLAQVDLITALENNFRENMTLVIHTDGLGEKLFTSSVTLLSKCNRVVCDRKTLVYMVKLFIRIRIHHVLREETRRLSQPNQKRNRKFLKMTHM